MNPIKRKMNQQNLRLRFRSCQQNQDKKTDRKTKKKMRRWYHRIHKIKKKQTGELKEINEYDFTKINNWMTEIQNPNEWKEKEEKLSKKDSKLYKSMCKNSNRVYFVLVHFLQIKVSAKDLHKWWNLGLHVSCFHSINDCNLCSTGETIDRKRSLLWILSGRDARSSRYEDRVVIFEWDLDSILHEYMKDSRLTGGRAWRLCVGDAIAACWQETEFEYYVLTKSADRRLILRTTCRKGASVG